MRRHIRLILLAVIVVALLLLSTVAFTVNQYEDIVLVKTFGKTAAVYDGRRGDQAGLKFKMIYPIQEEVRYDSRTFILEDAHEQVQTIDKHNLLLTMFCLWRIDDPVRFQSTIRTVEEARERLRTALRSAKSDVVGRRSLDDFVNTDPASMKLEQIERDILAAVSGQARRDYGVEVRMVGIKSIGLPEVVSKSIIDSMKEERQKDVLYYEGQGKSRAEDIVARADSASKQILVFAQRKAADIRTQGTLAAAAYYKDFAKNRQLSAFLRSLDSLKKELEKHTTIVLDATVLPTVDLFRKGPSAVPTAPPGELTAPQDKGKSGQ